MAEINNQNYCLGCFNPKEVTNKTCEICGYIEGEKPQSPVCLLPGSILHNHYVIGKELGHGGFGITYLAFNSQEKKKIAIKEFFPDGLVTRASGESNVHVYSDDVKESYDVGLKKFVEENKIISRFKNNPNIINVFDNFLENNTAYIVMEYIDGINLKQYLKKQGGKLSAKETLKLLMPVIDALDEVHQNNILHRDISPDNIYITKDGITKLLDFGAARQVFGDKSKSLSVILKPGFAPEEQYRRKGVQGPWTDIYALGATIYNMICGILLPDALDRLRDDGETKRPSEIGVSISPEIESVIMKAVAPDAANRYQSIREFRKSLLEAALADGTVQPDAGFNKKSSFFNFVKRNSLKIVLSAASVCIVSAITIVLAFSNTKGGIFGIFKGGKLLDTNATLSSRILSENSDILSSQITSLDSEPDKNQSTITGSSSSKTTSSTKTTSGSGLTTNSSDTTPQKMNIKGYGALNDFNNISDRQWALKNGNMYYFVIRSVPSDFNKSVLIRYDSNTKSAKKLADLSNGWLSDMYFLENKLYYVDGLFGYQINTDGGNQVKTTSRNNQYDNIYQYDGWLFKFSNVGITREIWPDYFNNLSIYNSSAQNCNNRNFAIYKDEIYFFDGNGNLCKTSLDGSGFKTILTPGPEHFRIADDSIVLITPDGKIYKTDLNGQNRTLLFQGIEFIYTSSTLQDYQSKIIFGNYIYLSCKDNDEFKTSVIKRFSLSGDGKSEVIAKTFDFASELNYKWSQSLMKFQILDGYLYMQICDSDFIGVKRINLSTKVTEDFFNVKDIVSEW